MKIMITDLTTDMSPKDLTDSLKSTLKAIYDCEDKRPVVVFNNKGGYEQKLSHSSLKDFSAWEKAVRQLEFSPAILVFLSKGDVKGLPFDLLLISDLRFVGAASKVGLALQNESIAPRMSLYRLTNQIGQAQARRFWATGNMITVDVARSLGLVDEVFSGEIDVCNSIQEIFGSLSSSDVAIRRRLLLEAHSLDYDTALGAYLALSAKD